MKSQEASVGPLPAFDLFLRALGDSYLSFFIERLASTRSLISQIQNERLSYKSSLIGAFPLHVDHLAYNMCPTTC
jgi:hypothetical protein